MPTELQGVSNFQQTQLNSVALLLPLSGDAKILGDIIKRGFNDAKADDSTAVQTFDTDSSDVNSLISQAKQQGANVIVGPLLKSRVDEMLLSPEIQNVNILALNATENVRNIAQVCYYGLSPESEAQSGAEKIYQDGNSVAIVAALKMTTATARQKPLPNAGVSLPIAMLMCVTTTNRLMPLPLFKMQV